MRTYIAYKYRCIEDKEKLKNDLEAISQSLVNKGHNTFILGRDVQKWNQSSSPIWQSAFPIICNLIKSDVVLAFVDCDAKSRGLPFEIFWSNLLGKKITLLIKSDIQELNLRKKAGKIIEFQELRDILPSLNV